MYAQTFGLSRETGPSRSWHLDTSFRVCEAHIPHGLQQGWGRPLLFQPVEKDGKRDRPAADLCIWLLDSLAQPQGTWRRTLEIVESMQMSTENKSQNNKPNKPNKNNDGAAAHSFNPLAPGLFEVVSRTPIMQTAQGRGRILANFLSCGHDMIWSSQTWRQYVSWAFIFDVLSLHQRAGAQYTQKITNSLGMLGLYIGRPNAVNKWSEVKRDYENPFNSNPFNSKGTPDWSNMGNINCRLGNLGTSLAFFFDPGAALLAPSVIDLMVWTVKPANPTSLRIADSHSLVAWSQARSKKIAKQHTEESPASLVRQLKSDSGSTTKNN